jgi:hypothetical protein
VAGVDHRRDNEYHTFLKNPENEQIRYAHVDHVGVFRFIQEVLSLRRNNPMQTFDRYAEVEEWLRTQWAGLYRELLSRMHQQKQISSLADKVAELDEVSKTLKRYIDFIITHVSTGNSAEIVREESERLRSKAVERAILESSSISHILSLGNLTLDELTEALLAGDPLRELSKMKKCRIQLLAGDPLRKKNERISNSS